MSFLFKNASVVLRPAYKSLNSRLPFMVSIREIRFELCGADINALLLVCEEHKTRIVVSEASSRIEYDANAERSLCTGSKITRRLVTLELRAYSISCVIALDTAEYCARYICD